MPKLASAPLTPLRLTLAVNKKYKGQGLVVLGFPSDQFGHQNPEDDETTGSVCQRNHGVTFPLLKKGDVNGSNAHPVFQYLKPKAKGILGERVSRSVALPFLASLTNSLRRRLHGTSPSSSSTRCPASRPSPFAPTDPFRLSQRGNVIHRYAPITKPDAIAADIEKALAESV